jgi:hypothetical protein
MAPLAADAKGKSRPVVSAAGRGAHCRARSGGVQFKRLFKIVTGFARRERCGDMTVDPNEFTKQLFTAGQQPASWLRSAGRLRDAAEAIIKHELPAERSYFQAWKIADEEASAESLRNETGVGHADIKAIAPNYPPAQLLYAYAIENVLKGLIVLKQPGLIQERRLHDKLMTHDLNDLADKAEVTVDQQHEQPVLEALSRLSVSAGRYPVAVTRSLDTPDPNEWLGYGSAHPIMRTFFERVYRELESAVPEQIARFATVVVFR